MNKPQSSMYSSICTAKSFLLQNTQSRREKTTNHWSLNYFVWELDLQCVDTGVWFSLSDFADCNLITCLLCVGGMNVKEESVGLWSWSKICFQKWKHHQIMHTAHKHTYKYTNHSHTNTNTNTNTCEQVMFWWVARGAGDTCQTDSNRI